jgi:paraquat-inducible protein B
MTDSSATPTPPENTPPEKPPEALPSARVQPARKRPIQLVWVVPAIAVLIGAWLAVKTYLETGPTITISFQTAEGLEAGKTKIRYKSVEMGEVKAIALAPDKKGVIVTGQVTPEAAKLLVEDTRFWIVRPRVAGGQVSGLTTLLSGSYIGMDLGKSEESQRDFKGLDVQPNITADEPGREFILQAGTLGSLDIGSPVYYRQVQVGEITADELNKDGSGVTLHVFVRSPYEKFVTENTRFWQASGVDVTLDASGIKLQTQSLISILLGGIAFQEPPESGTAPQAKANHVFNLFAEQALAMRRLDTEVTHVVAYFTESVRGLSPGAPIDFQGIVIGEVKSIDLEFKAEKNSFRVPVQMDLYSDRVRTDYTRFTKQGFDGRKLMFSLIDRGLRAQLRSGNLLTGQRYVALDFFPKAAPVKIDPTQRSGTGLPEIPTVNGSLEELQVTLGNIASKIDKIPFDDLSIELKQTLQSLQVTMNSTDQFVQRMNKDVAPQLSAAMADARKTMSDASKLLASDAPVQQDLRGALRELTRAAQSLRVLTDYIELHPQSLIFGKPAEKNVEGEK